MAKNNNLTDFLTDLANTIRTKKGYASTTKLNPQDFSSEISSITTAVKNQIKTGINPSTSSQTITFDSGYTGLASVQINAMPTMTLPTSATTTKPSGTTKATFSRSASTRYLVIPAGYNSTAAYYTISAVGNAVFSNSLSSRSTILTTVTPGVSTKYAYPTKAGYVPTTSAVKINGDSKLVAGNIKKGVSIFGVAGTYEGSGSGSSTSSDIFNDYY